MTTPPEYSADHAARAIASGRANAPGANKNGEVKLNAIPLSKSFCEKYWRADFESGDIYNLISGRATKTKSTCYSYLICSATDSSGVSRKYFAHRVMWCLYNGDIPHNRIIDHINGDTFDNRPKNLRLVSASGNSRNAKMRSDNTSGHSCVRKKHGKWSVSVRVNGELFFLGSFFDIWEAVAVRDEFYKNNGFSARHGMAEKGQR